MKRILILMLLLFPALAFSQEIENYLILNNIGEYIFRPKRVITIQNAGILVPTGHFPGHGDMTYEGIYIHPQTYIGVEVKVTQHSGSDSDKWLLHEVERGFRRSKDLQATYVSPNPLREINGNRIWYTWGYYEWVSNNVVVYINFTDLTGTKSEPLEVVRAYLAKFPSTIPAITIDRAYNEKWLKDEMERRLWLCDKWFYQLQLQKAEQKAVLQNTVDSMQVFLDYREKYYGIKALDDKKLLSDYLMQNNGTGIRNKLKEYKDWWNINKTGAINLP